MPRQGTNVDDSSQILLAVFDGVALVVQNNVSVDRGHRHSSGMSQVALWVSSAGEARSVQGNIPNKGNGGDTEGAESAGKDGKGENDKTPGDGGMDGKALEPITQTRDGKRDNGMGPDDMVQAGTQTRAGKGNGGDTEGAEPAGKDKR